MSGKTNKRAKKLEEKLQCAREFETVHEELIRTAEAVRQTQSAPTTPYKYATVRERVDRFSNPESKAITSLDLSVTNMATLTDFIASNAIGPAGIVYTKFEGLQVCALKIEGPAVDFDI